MVLGSTAMFLAVFRSIVFSILAAAYTASCSPDLNPIEMAFAKLKQLLRKAKARTYDALWAAVGNICSLFEPNECRNYLKDAGYVAD